MGSLFNKKILITGGHGLLGSCVVKKLKLINKKINLILPKSSEYNLTIESDVRRLFKTYHNIDYIIHLASSHGGLYYNIKNSGSIYYKNILLNTHLIHYAMLAKVKKFLCAGTVDCYPKKAKTPWKEKDLWQGYPEETSAAYAFSKKMMIVQAAAYKQQYNFKVINLLLMNLYGPNDNYNLKQNHVIPAIIKKIYLSIKKKKIFIELFGSGNQKREFLYVDDAADAIILALKKYNSEAPLNIGTGKAYSIKELANKIIKNLNVNIKVKWKKNVETGIKLKLFNINQAKKTIGYRTKVDLDKGLNKTIAWYKNIGIKKKNNY